MRILHHIGLNTDDRGRRELTSMGLKQPPVQPLVPHLVILHVAENDEAWPKLVRWLKGRRYSDIAETFFSDEEVAAAELSALLPVHVQGYPQPRSGEFGYLPVTYDLADYCPVCGIGKWQKAPFQMTGEPRWGKHGIMQLWWVPDEYFVRPHVWHELFEPLGIGARPVVKRGSVVLATVVQLVVEERVPLVVDGLAHQTCPRCGRVKYLPIQRGPQPGVTARPTAAMARSKEYFGDGLAAIQRDRRRAAACPCDPRLEARRRSSRRRRADGLTA